MTIPSADTTQRLFWIRALEAAGFGLTPLRGKKAYLDEWEHTAVGQHAPEKLAGGNYGVVLKATDLVVDVDPRNGGAESLEKLLFLAGDFRSDAFAVKTGGGGFHYYLTKPADFPVRYKHKEFPGIEFKYNGGQVVGPLSIHPDSHKPYEVFCQIAPAHRGAAPAPLLELLKRPAEESASFSDVGTGQYKTDEGTIKLYADYLLNEAPASGSFLVACRGRDYALPPQKTWELMVEHWSERRTTFRTPDELKSRVLHAYRYASGAVGNAHPSVHFDAVVPAVSPPGERQQEEEVNGTQVKERDWVVDRHGVAQPCFLNLLKYLTLPNNGLSHLFGYNEFTNSVEFMDTAPWHRGKTPMYAAVHDEDLKQLKGYLVNRYGFEMPVNALEEAMLCVAKLRSFHPVRDYLESLVWDGTARLDTWLTDYLGVEDSNYTRACARKTLCAAVMRIYRPGCKFDAVLVLEGDQGIGKSGVCQILGGPWFVDSPLDPHNKDTVQILMGKWIAELGEMDVTRKADVEALKAFLTRQTDKVRLAYGRLAREFPRQSIFIASKNPNASGTYLKDDTGNRRWWPVACDPPHRGLVDFKAFKDVRNQLWAEAVMRAKAGEHLFMDTSELKAEAACVVALRHADDAWMERIGSWLAERGRLVPSRESLVTAREVFVDALGGVDKQLDHRTTLRIASVLKRLGYDAVAIEKNGVPMRGFEKRRDAAADFLG